MSRRRALLALLLAGCFHGPKPLPRLCIDRWEGTVAVPALCAPEGWDPTPILDHLHARDPGGDIVL